MPVMLNSRAAVEEHLHRLEIHYLASPDDQLHFALLSDWLDADTEHTAHRRRAARHRHARHRAAQPALRPGRRRRTLPAAASPARLERERAALDGLGAQARQAARSSIACCAAPPTPLTSRAPADSPWVPDGVRYVLTLDADTRVPRETPRRLIGKMAHPLNRPRFDAQARPRGRRLRHPAAARRLLAAR